MHEGVIVDTDILIDAGRSVPAAIKSLGEIEQRHPLAISVVTQMELIVGCGNKSELRMLERFLGRFQIFKINEQIADSAVALLKRYRLSHGLLIADSLIAATAKVLDVPLMTKNERDFRFIEELHLLSYPKL